MRRITLLGRVLLPWRIDSSIAQGFGFVVPARARRNTLRISRARAGATEPKNKRAAGQYAMGAALLLLPWAGSAHASDLALEWTAPRGCPTQETLREGLATRLGREVTVSSGAPIELRGTVIAHGGGYALDVRTRSAAGSERRELRARSCNELARASILIAALLLMDGSGSAASPGAIGAGNRNIRTRARIPESSTSRLSVFARTWVRGDLGSMPAAAVGPGLAVGLAIANTRLELGGTYLPAQQMHFAGSTESLGSVQLMAAHAGVCQVLIRTPQLGPCLRAEIGQLRARGQNLAQTATQSSAWFLGAVSARLSFELWRGLFWQSELAAGMPLERIRIAVRDLDQVHRMPAVVGRFETGLLLSF